MLPPFTPNTDLGELIRVRAVPIGMRAVSTVTTEESFTLLAFAVVHSPQSVWCRDRNLVASRISNGGIF
jgi:hypothetical protein